MDDRMRAELDAIEAQIDAEQYAREIDAQKAALVTASYDVTIWRMYRANGLGRIGATLLTAIRAATDLV